MEQKYNIELIEEYEDINFYSIHLEGEELSEFENFFEKFPEGCSYDEEIDVVISWLDKISERGALERYFRPEGHYGDGVGVIPIDIGNKIRLYCIRLSNKILIFGNGGVKDAKSWQQSTTLAPYVKLLIDTRVSIVKLCVPRIHLLISASRFPSRRARSFCFIPLETRMSCILSTIWKDKSTDLRISGSTCLRRSSKILLLFISCKV